MIKAIDTSRYLDTYYSWSALDTKRIGNYVGTGLKQLVASGYSIDKIHLIGNGNMKSLIFRIIFY